MNNFLRDFIFKSTKARIPSRIGGGMLTQIGLINPMAHVYAHIGPFSQHLKNASVTVARKTPLKAGMAGLPNNWVYDGYFVGARKTPDGVRIKEVPVYWPREFIAPDKPVDEFAESVSPLEAQLADSPDLAREILRLQKVWK